MLAYQVLRKVEQSFCIVLSLAKYEQAIETFTFSLILIIHNSYDSFTWASAILIGNVLKCYYVYLEHVTINGSEWNEWEWVEIKIKERERDECVCVCNTNKS